jgi:hypothetical protein
MRVLSYLRCVGGECRSQSMIAVESSVSGVATAARGIAFTS